MAELTFKSAGVATREIDLSGPTTARPQGTPAGIVGTALKGPAFVPVTVATYQDFVAEFGATDGEKFGPLAMNEWMKNARAGTYVRVLGCGDAQRRTSDTDDRDGNVGKVTNAGFVVGAAQVQPVDVAGAVDGFIGDNIGAGAGIIQGTLADPEPGVNGRTYFLGALMAPPDAGALGATAGDSTVLSDAGIAVDQLNAHPILRGVVMAASGVCLALSSSRHSFTPGANNDGNNSPSVAARNRFGTTPGVNDGGYLVGTVNKQDAGAGFVMLLNGHTNTPDHPNILTASFDPQAPDHFANIFNTDPGCIEEAGHYLYAYWDIWPDHAVVTGSGVIADAAAADPLGNARTVDGEHEDVAFLLTGSLGWNSGSLCIPNYENFEDRYRTASSPWVISQRYGGKPKNLFKVHALDDGVAGSSGFKISIANVQASGNESTDFGTFDLFIRDMEDDDNNQVVLEKYYKLDINPSSERYIGRVIGDMYAYYDFDKPDGAQKLVIEGIHPNRSKYIRIEMDDRVDNNTIDDSAIPCGYRGYDHLVTSGTLSGMTIDKNTEFYSQGMPVGAPEPANYPPATETKWHATSLLINPVMDSATNTDIDVFTDNEILKKVVEMPVPVRQNLTTGVVPKQKVNTSLYWGTQFQVNDDLQEPNKSRVFNKSIYSYTKYFPNFQNAWLNMSVGDNSGVPDNATVGLMSPADNGVGGVVSTLTTVLDVDRFNNNIFTLENVEVQAGSTGPLSVDAKEWANASYRRDGTPSGKTPAAGNAYRFLGGEQFLDDFSSLGTKRYLKFSFFLQGGFDGNNVFDKQKSKMTNLAARREMIDSTNQGGTKGPTVGAYRKGIDVMAEKADVDIKLLAIPGLRDPAVTDYAIDATEERFDAMYIMDIEERDDQNDVIIDRAGQKPNVTNTVGDLQGRNLDTSFAAAYYPDVVITDPKTQTNVVCAPSVAVLGAFSLNDSVAHPWFAPAGFTRGALKSVVESQVKVNRANLDALYEADINPISAFPHTPGVVVWGQKTLQAAKSALDRVNVRRLLIEVRRQVKRVGNTLLFEPNREETLARFSAAVNPILQRIQAQQGLDRFKVIIDTTTTTQADVENNTVRGKIFLQPTRTVEFISLDFVVTNAGMEV